CLWIPSNSHAPECRYNNNDQYHCQHHDHRHEKFRSRLLALSLCPRFPVLKGMNRFQTEQFCNASRSFSQILGRKKSKSHIFLYLSPFSDILISFSFLYTSLHFKTCPHHLLISRPFSPGLPSFLIVFHNLVPCSFHSHPCTDQQGKLFQNLRIISEKLLFSGSCRIIYLLPSPCSGRHKGQHSHSHHLIPVDG